MREAVLGMLLLASCATSGCDALEKATGLTYTEPGATNWPSHVTAVSDGETLDADLSEGSSIDVEWADQADVACWPGTEHDNFRGAHVFYAALLPQQSTLQVTVTPDSDVDVSVYLLASGVAQFEMPPQVEAAVDCEAGYDAPNDSNPGEPESASLTSGSDAYNVLIGVAGAEGHTPGGFAIDVDITGP